MNTPRHDINEIHDAMQAFRKCLIEDGILPDAPEKVYLPADLYDVCVEQARQFYPGVRFISDAEIVGILTVARDPEGIN